MSCGTMYNIHYRKLLTPPLLSNRYLLDNLDNYLSNIKFTVHVFEIQDI